jgi:hypothetical protein
MMVEEFCRWWVIMADDVIWIVTDETPAVILPDGSRSGQDRGNPYDDSDDVGRTPGRRGIPVSAEKLEQGVTEFVQVMGRVLQHVKQNTHQLAGMALDEIELAVEVNGEGQLSLLRIGGKAGAKGAMTLKFKAPQP